jgi:hypothetical protein
MRSFGVIFQIDKTFKFPDVIDLDKVLRPNGLMPIPRSIHRVDSLHYMIKYLQSLSLIDLNKAHIVHEIGFVGLSYKGKNTIIRYGHNDLVEMLGEGNAVHVGQDFLIVLESLIQAVLLEFGDGKYSGVVHCVIVLILSIEGGVELVIELGDLLQEA